MTQSDQIRDDLSFVTDVIRRRGDSPFRFTAPYYIWAVYVLTGYCLLDFYPRIANWFFLLAWLPAGMATGIARKIWTRKHGELDDLLAQKARLHLMVGGLLAIASVIGLAICVPVFRGPVTGQVMVILFGLIYFLAGVHFDRTFLWLGPLMMIGGITVGFVPHFGWSAMGVMIAAGLCTAAILNTRRQRLLADNGL